MIYKNRTSKWMLGTYVVAAILIGTSALFVAGCESQVSKENDIAKTEAKTGDNKRIFTEVEVQPEYPGGNEAMFHFLARNIKYPAPATRANVSGKVFVNFVVKADGNIEDVKVLKGIGFGCDQEAVRVISKFPKWTPGKQNGKAVSVKYTVPINFMLAEEGQDTSTDKETTVVGFKPVADAPEAHQPDTKITIRGTSGPFTPENKPLYILNGEVMEQSFDLNTIDANTIKSMNVLKGESATKIYGAKGRNGVISIITKDQK